MTVYVVIRSIKYEYEEILQIFQEKERATEFIEEEVRLRSNEHNELVFKNERAEGRSESIYIQEWEVK